MSQVRTRFPPSPTGYLHIGGARTALFNFLFARHYGGRFVLRIEDTDRERSTEESVVAILDSLRWLGLEWDEGPFFQSQRTELYRTDAERLLRQGKAYRCYCTPEELEAKRQAALKSANKPMYDRSCRQRTEAPPGRPFAVRFKAPIEGETIVADRVKGPVIFDNRELDDLIIMRSDNTATYNFCVVVDDALMEINHIIRGDDHLANTPKQIQMYQALGYAIPEFAHIPLILGADRTRLSKRHGATSVMTYYDMGYLPDALVNYLARLGWAHGDQEIFTRQELIEYFSLENVGKAAGVYNAEKAEWLNAHYIKAMAAKDLVALLKPYIAAKGYELREDDAWLEKMIKTLQERAKTLVEMVEMAHFYLSDDIAIDATAAAKHLRPEAMPTLGLVRDLLAGVGAWDHDSIKGCFDKATAQLGVGLGKVAQPVRVALTGGTVSPGIFEVLEVLGKARSLTRLDHALVTAGATTG